MSSQFHTALTTALIAGLAFASPALAHRDRGPAKINFEEIDANNNGGVSKAEFTAHRASKAAELDANNDGNISEEELMARFEGKGKGRKAKRGAGRILERADANEDGVLSVAEFASHGQERMDRMFEHLDIDENGEISKDEFAEMRKKRKNR